MIVIWCEWNWRKVSLLDSYCNIILYAHAKEKSYSIDQ